MCVLTAWSPFRPAQEHSWKEVREGLTTEAEVEAWFGPPCHSGVFVLDQHMARLRGLPDRTDGQPVAVALKHWWHDDDHIMELEIDDAGLVIRCRGPSINPPRSAIRRWWRETARPYLFE
jgi:hypothetical protein